jgi:CheY-like chemotaxis protein
MAEQTIVVANDDPIYLELIKELLADEGYPSVHCVTGERVCDFIVQAQPDLILLDIHIEQAGRGWHHLDMLRLNPRTAAMPVIICSTDGRLLREKAEHLQTLHCDTLEKPFDLEMLLAKIRVAIGPPLKPGTD